MLTKQLIEKCLEYDRKSYQELFKLVFKDLHEVCSRYHNNKEDIQSALNEIFLKVLHSIKPFLKSEKDVNTFGYWCRKIALNYIIDEYRKSKKYRSTILFTENYDGLENYTQEEDNLDFNPKLELALNKLPELNKVIVILKVIEGYKHKEIAEKLQLNENTVRVMFRNTLVKLKENLNSENISIAIYLILFN